MSGWGWEPSSSERPANALLTQVQGLSSGNTGQGRGRITTWNSQATGVECFYQAET